MTNHEKAPKLLGIVKEIYEEGKSIIGPGWTVLTKMGDSASRDAVAGMVMYFNRCKESDRGRRTYERLNRAGKKSLESEEHRFMAIARELVLIAAVIALGGWVSASRQAWTKAGASADALARDRYACIQESRVPYGTSFGSAGLRPHGAAGGPSGSSSA